MALGYGEPGSGPNAHVLGVPAANKGRMQREAFKELGIDTNTTNAKSLWPNCEE